MRPLATAYSASSNNSMRTNSASFSSPPTDDTFDTRVTPRMKPRVLALDPSLFSSPHSNEPLFDQSYTYASKSLYLQRGQSWEDLRDRLDTTRESPVITLDFVQGLISTLRQLEPNYVLPKVGRDAQSLHLFVAQLCSSLLHWLSQIKSKQDGGLEAALDSHRRSLMLKEQDLSDVAQRLIEERKDIENERELLQGDREELEQLRRECLREREALRVHVKEVERQTEELEKDIAERQREERSEEARRSAVAAKMQQLTKQQQALKKEIEDLDREKCSKATLLAELNTHIEERQVILAQSPPNPQFDSKSHYFDSLQSQLELDKTRHRIQSDQSQLEQQRADLITEELKFNDAFNKRVTRLGLLGEELEQRNQELSRAKERFDMCRTDLESQIDMLKTRLAESRKSNNDLIEKVASLQEELAEVTDELQTTKLQEKLRVVSVSQTQADLSFLEQQLSERESELEAKLEAAAGREEAYKQKLRELAGVEDSLKAAQEALALMKRESSAGGQQLAQKWTKLKQEVQAFEAEKAAFLQQTQSTKTQIEAEQAKLLANKSDLERIIASSHTLSQEAQETRSKLRSDEETLQKDKDKVKELVTLLEIEGSKLTQKEEQLRTFARQLNSREQQLYDREKSLRRKEFRLQDHKAEREALKLRTPVEERDLFDSDEMLSCTLSPSPGEPHSLERSPYPG